MEIFEPFRLFFVFFSQGDYRLRFCPQCLEIARTWSLYLLRQIKAALVERFFADARLELSEENCT